MVLQQRHGLGQSARSYAEGTLDDLRLADDAALEGESPSLTLAQRPHDLEALDRGVGRLQRLESAHGPDQQLELAVGTSLRMSSLTDQTRCLTELSSSFEWSEEIRQAIS